MKFDKEKDYLYKTDEFLVSELLWVQYNLLDYPISVIFCKMTDMA